MLRKFLHKLEPAEGESNYLVGGQVWRGWNFSDWDTLNLESGDVAYSVEGAHDGFTWNFRKQIADGCSFRHSGNAPTVEEACRAALDFVPEVVCLEYLGRSFLCYGRPGRNGATVWTFAAGDGQGEVVGPGDYSNGDRFSWRREWSPCREILERFCDASGDLHGRAPSMMEALIAAVDAPELFKRACGRMIATLSEADHD